MRFNTIQELFQWAKDKGFVDSPEGARQKIKAWWEKKKSMFSPEEQQAIKDQYQQGNWENFLRLLAHVWLDEKEGNPRRKAIIVIKANLLEQANAIAQQLDPIGGDKTFGGLGLSKSGNEPTQAYWCSWNMSQKEWEFIEENFGSLSGVQIFDGNIFTAQQVLDTLGLLRIEEVF